MTAPCIWEVSASPYHSDFLNGTIKFGENEPVYLIDQFSGKRPAIINQDFLLNGEIHMNFGACALFDSNVVDKMDSFVRTGKASDGFNAFLDFLTRKGWDFSLLFYYFEHFTKSSHEHFFPNAVRRTRSLLTLHAMDENLYLATGIVKENPEAVRHYTNGLDASALDEVAENRVSDFIKRTSKSQFTVMVESIEIVLLKMVLIRRFEMTDAEPLAQHEELHRFMKEDLNIVLARELHLGIHYFCDNAGKLLGIQKNTSFEKAMKNIKSTAWDMFLMRLPDMIPYDVSGGVFLNYMATQEKNLHELANLFSIEQVISFDGERGLPVIGYNMVNIRDDIISALPKPDTSRLFKLYERNAIPLGLYESLKRQLSYYLDK